MLGRKRTVPWTAYEDRKLTMLWEANWSTTAIGIELGRGKNAVCGRARRLDLPMRESPIRETIDPEKVHQFRQQMVAGIDAAREQIADVVAIKRQYESAAERSAKTLRLAQEHRDMVNALRVDRAPCTYCGVRGDYGCKHRRAA